MVVAGCLSQACQVAGEAIWTAVNFAQVHHGKRQGPHPHPLEDPLLPPPSPPIASAHLRPIRVPILPASGMRHAHPGAGAHGQGHRCIPHPSAPLHPSPISTTSMHSKWRLLPRSPSSLTHRPTILYHGLLGWGGGYGVGVRARAK